MQQMRPCTRQAKEEAQRDGQEENSKGKANIPTDMNENDIFACVQSDIYSPYLLVVVLPQ